METETSVIRNVRRKVIIDRHRPVITDMEASLSDGFVDGTLEHPRLQAMLRELEEESEQNRIHATVAKLLKDGSYAGLPLQEALIAYLALMREDHDLEVATLQLHAVGVYRAMKAMILERRGFKPLLDELRAMGIDDLVQFNGSQRIPFACIDFAGAMTCPKQLSQRTAARIREIRKVPEQAPRWEDDTQGMAIPRELEEQVAELPERERKLAIKDLLADQVRSRFYQQVFLSYFTIDEFDPASVEGFDTMLEWIEAIRETPHLFPFMQGQSMEQKNFRLANLVTKIIQMAEMYQRVAQARADEAFGPQLEGRNTRESLSVMAKAKYPPGVVDDAFVAACFQFPLLDFVTWVQERIAEQDLVLPPEPRKHRGRPGTSTRIQQITLD